MAKKTIPIQKRWATDRWVGAFKFGSASAQKGDVPGHEFHGNQWSGGGGGLSSGERSAAESLGLSTKYSGSDSRAEYAGEAVDNPLPQTDAITYKDIPAEVAQLRNKDYETTDVLIDNLVSAQDYVQPSAVLSYVDKIKDGSLYAVKPIVLQRGGQQIILNGNHQLLAAKLTGQRTYPVRLYNGDE